MIKTMVKVVDATTARARKISSIVVAGLGVVSSREKQKKVQQDKIMIMMGFRLESSIRSRVLEEQRRQSRQNRRSHKEKGEIDGKLSARN